MDSILTNIVLQWVVSLVVESNNPSQVIEQMLDGFGIPELVGLLHEPALWILTPYLIRAIRRQMLPDSVLGSDLSRVLVGIVFTIQGASAYRNDLLRILYGEPIMTPNQEDVADIGNISFDSEETEAIRNIYEDLATSGIDPDILISPDLLDEA